MVVINGSLDNLQSSLDFFLNITSKNIVADSKEMRDRFFSIFKEEDSYREENFLMFQERASDDYDIVENPSPLLVGEEEVYSFGCCSFAEESFVNEDYPDDGEVYIEDDFVEQDYDSSYSENEKVGEYTYSHQLENEKNEIDTEIEYFDEEENSLDIEKNDLEVENIELDDDEFIDYSYSEKENIK